MHLIVKAGRKAQLSALKFSVFQKYFKENRSRIIDAKLCVYVAKIGSQTKLHGTYASHLWQLRKYEVMIRLFYIRSLISPPIVKLLKYFSFC